VSLKLKPLGDRVIIQPSDDDVEKSPGGIYIPETAKEKPQKGKVVAVGTGRTTDEGNTIKMSVKLNDIVIYSKYAGTEYSENGADFLIVKESDILAIVS
jgi:chaperonin GroES